MLRHTYRPRYVIASSFDIKGETATFYGPSDFTPIAYFNGVASIEKMGSAPGWVEALPVVREINPLDTEELQPSEVLPSSGVVPTSGVYEEEARQGYAPYGSDEVPF